MILVVYCILYIDFSQENSTLPFMTDAPTTQHAISAALDGNWKEAIRINTLLIKLDKTSVDALNRLGFAYLKTGQLTLSKRIFQKVLAFDKYNQIAQKNIKKLGTVKKKDVIRSIRQNVSPLHFLEEPGKTKIVSCVHLTQETVLSALYPGQEVVLKAKNHCIEIRDEKNAYLAALPDDVSFKLLKLLKAGNTYQAVIKGTGKNILNVMLREITRGKRFLHQPSFIASQTYVPFTHVEGAIDKPNSAPTGEDDEQENDEVEPPSETREA